MKNYDQEIKNKNQEIKRLNKRITELENEISIRDYTAGYLKEINICRANPSLYALEIENVIQFIKEDKEKNTFTFEKEGMPKIPLIKGEVFFREVAEKLRRIQPIQLLEVRDDLRVPISNDPLKVTEWNSMKEAVDKVVESFKETSNYKSYCFHYDVGPTNAKNSFILQLVDDAPFNLKRQKNILNPDFKYIGINAIKIKNKNCGYFLFAN